MCCNNNFSQCRENRSECNSCNGTVYTYSSETYNNRGCGGCGNASGCGCGNGNDNRSGCGCGNGNRSGCGCGNDNRSGCGSGNGNRSGCGCGNGNRSGCVYINPYTNVAFSGCIGMYGKCGCLK